MEVEEFQCLIYILSYFHVVNISYIFQEDRYDYSDDALLKVPVLLFCFLFFFFFLHFFLQLYILFLAYICLIHLTRYSICQRFIFPSKLCVFASDIRRALNNSHIKKKIVGRFSLFLFFFFFAFPFQNIAF